MGINNIRSFLLARLSVIIFIGLFGAPIYAAIDVYQFNNDSERDRFYTLTEELRCPKCQNQNIADSNAPIAQDLRTKIHSMIGEKRSDQEIIDYMIERYGDFVLYQPRITNKTYILWFGPSLLLVLGLVIVILIARRNSARIKQRELNTTKLDSAQQQQLDTLLNDKGNQSS